MKHPTVIKTLALILAAISLSALVSGIYGLHFALKARNSDNNEIRLLQSQIEEYRDISVRLTELPDIEAISFSLDKVKQDHQALSTHHRKELSIYTATKSGLEAGVKGLAEARAALTTGKAQYESEKKQLEMQTEAFEQIFVIAAEAEQLINELIPLLNYAETVLNSLNNLIDKAYAIGDILDSSEEDSEAMRLSAVEAYDAVIETWSDAVLLVDALEDTEISTTFLRIALESAGITSKEDLRILFEEAGLPVSDDQFILIDQIMDQDSVILITSQQVSEARTSLETATGMPVEEFYGKLLSERDGLLTGEAEFAINADQFGSIRHAYSDNREAILRFADMIADYVPQLEGSVSSAWEMVNSAETMLGQMNEANDAVDSGIRLLEEAGSQLETAEAMLTESERQLSEEENKLKQKADELEREKAKLDQQEQMILTLEGQKNERESLNRREKQLSLSLRARDGLDPDSDQNVDLLTAAEKWLDDYSSDAAESFRRWFASCILMILAFLFSFLCIPVCFSTPMRTHYFFLLTSLCMLASFGSLVLLILTGRGISYSALIIFCLATIQLFISLFLISPSPPVSVVKK